MANGSGGAGNFFKAIILPLLISAALYAIIFHALLPLYRQHRARYLQYLPLQSNSLSSRLPSSLQPSTLRDQFSHILLKIFLPSTWAFRERFRRRPSVTSATDDVTLFDEESGEAMVGFDVHTNRDRRRDGMERQISRMVRSDLRSHHNNDPDDSGRRLSRELEEGFRDDSDDEAETSTVTAGRRSFSVAR